MVYPRCTIPTSLNNIACLKPHDAPLPLVVLFFAPYHQKRSIKPLQLTAQTPSLTDLGHRRQRPSRVRPAALPLPRLQTGV